VLLFSGPEGCVFVFVLAGLFLTKLSTWLVHYTMMPVKKNMWNGGLMVIFICMTVSYFSVDQWNTCRLALVWNLHWFGICTSLRILEFATSMELKRRWDSAVFIFTLDLFHSAALFVVKKVVFLLIQKIVLYTIVLTRVLYKRFLYKLCVVHNLVCKIRERK